MGWFGKNKGVVDLTRNQSKTAVKEEYETGEVVDLSSRDSENNSSANGLGFLGDLAGAGNSTGNVNPSPGPITSGLRDARDSKREKLRSALNRMDFKIDDNEYKINDLIDRMREMDKRIRELERDKKY
ncbi:hypothetical protein COU62_01095 [Candidatus Pacearchaeota archaeon CG10_big_fil_rev_8_21_14_0_10_35_219]|nr:hypothetical protein [Candidatus Pacearchaeota archaeon]OIO43034.1 MAG: hypothetical protein AUJ63_01265 [Candidatus Pacearchaeota archaeon CG1_02_35_32]PIO08160.1 MAG: hypothetical protein COU62_01095 [Candidatus Pacearchaeota archaeon CG10_big_fil_rev_8_21_14_0_10_35_219]PIY81093.1 MAG: hypothetical protein COY79_04810 [Candidatus Pacearchaeota archaeon CG_4_10_14_0_8_um_filter_35_169]PIZ80334.1 MAG: hypothetical protein COY00_01515 [Candidatus Pacearchaeota archaeon CG_4_10_14_0_2_um_filt